jgi:hypothetical protein
LASFNPTVDGEIEAETMADRVRLPIEWTQSMMLMMMSAAAIVPALIKLKSSTLDSVQYATIKSLACRLFSSIND